MVAVLIPVGTEIASQTISRLLIVGAPLARSIALHSLPDLFIPHTLSVRRLDARTTAFITFLFPTLSLQSFTFFHYYRTVRIVDIVSLRVNSPSQ